MTILHIDSSLQPADASVSRRLTAGIVAALVDGTGEDVVYHDLATEPPMAGNPRAGDSPSADEFLSADVIVIGAPMYNLGIPASLKAWVDAISIPRKTFRYSEHGPEGLAGGRRVVVAYASGGFHHGPDEDFVEPYFRALFRMLGIADIDVIRAEGINVSDEHRAKALTSATARVTAVARRIKSERVAA